VIVSGRVGEKKIAFMTGQRVKRMAKRVKTGGRACIRGAEPGEKKCNSQRRLKDQLLRSGKREKIGRQTEGAHGGELYLGTAEGKKA